MCKGYVWTQWLCARLCAGLRDEMAESRTIIHGLPNILQTFLYISGTFRVVLARSVLLHVASSLSGVVLDVYICVVIHMQVACIKMSIRIRVCCSFLRDSCWIADAAHITLDGVFFLSSRGVARFLSDSYWVVDAAHIFLWRCLLLLLCSNVFDISERFLSDRRCYTHHHTLGGIFLSSVE